MLGLIPENLMQGYLLVEPPDEEYQQCLMATLNDINQQFEPETLRFAASGLERPWWLKSQMRSPRFTTRWNELPIVKAGELSKAESRTAKTKEQFQFLHFLIDGWCNIPDSRT